LVGWEGRGEEMTEKRKGGAPDLTYAVGKDPLAPLVAAGVAGRGERTGRGKRTDRQAVFFYLLGQFRNKLKVPGAYAPGF
jgi:hypothetical protein